jgi:hypothetical protein
VSQVGPTFEPVVETIIAPIASDLPRRQWASSTAAVAPAQSDNPFAAPPTGQVDPTVMLRSEDFAADIAALATPAISPVTARGEIDEHDDDYDDYDDDYDDFDELEIPDFDPDAGPPRAYARARWTRAKLRRPSPHCPWSPWPTSGRCGARRREPRRGSEPRPSFSRTKRKRFPRSPSRHRRFFTPWLQGRPRNSSTRFPVDADYPEVLQTALTDLNGAIEANDSLLICGQMQRCFDLMIQFFAGIAGRCCKTSTPTTWATSRLKMAVSTW